MPPVPGVPFAPYLTSRPNNQTLRYNCKISGNAMTMTLTDDDGHSCPLCETKWTHVLRENYTNQSVYEECPKCGLVRRQKRKLKNPGRR